MSFWVKLIQVIWSDTDQARESLKANCHHLANDLWLFEGEELALEEDGIQLRILDEQAIEGYGDLTDVEILDMVRETYVFDHKLLT